MSWALEKIMIPMDLGRYSLSWLMLRHAMYKINLQIINLNIKRHAYADMLI